MAAEFDVVFWPDEAKLALTKLAEHDFDLKTEGRRDGRWTLTMFQHGEEGIPGDTEFTEVHRHLFDTASSLADATGKTKEEMVRRVETLRILSTDLQVPDNVQRYLKEATECYIFGRFIACLIVCRSAIEFALRDHPHLHGAPGGLDALIALGRDKLPWTLRPTLDFADAVRIQANQAVHSALPPSAEVCREMFANTRGVLRDLYTTQDLLGPLGSVG